MSELLRISPATSAELAVVRERKGEKEGRRERSLANDMYVDDISLYMKLHVHVYMNTPTSSHI